MIRSEMHLRNSGSRFESRIALDLGVMLLRLGFLVQSIGSLVSMPSDETLGDEKEDGWLDAVKVSSSKG